MLTTTFLQTDHPTKSIVLLLRGTLSLDDIATDLACEATEFDSSLYWDEDELPKSSGEDGAKYKVHGGMWDVAVAMGSPFGAVNKAVGRALRDNEDYCLSSFSFFL